MNESLNTEPSARPSASSDEQSISAFDVLNPMKANPPEYQDLVSQSSEKAAAEIPDTEPTAEDLQAQKKAEDDAQAEYDAKASAEAQEQAEKDRLNAGNGAASTAEALADQEARNAQALASENPVLDAKAAADQEKAQAEDSHRKGRSRS